MSTTKKELARVALKKRQIAVSGEDTLAAERAELDELAREHGVPCIDLACEILSLHLLEMIPRVTAEQHQLLPIRAADGVLIVAMANPRPKVIEELEFVTAHTVEPRVAPASQIAELTEKAYLAQKRGEAELRGPRARSEPPPTARNTGLNPSGDDGRQAAGARDAAEEPFTSLIPELEGLEPLDGLESEDGRPSFAGRRALVVEDDSEIRQMIRRLLEFREMRVIEASDGTAALEALACEIPNLVVLDGMLPRVHGFEILRRMRASERFAEVPVIVVTAEHRGWEYAADLEQGYGVRHFLEKPFNSQRFLRAVDESMGESVQQISDAAAAELKAGISAFKSGQSDTALKHIERGIALDPLAYQLYFHLGLLRGKRGQAFEAISAIKHAVELNPLYFPALKNLAILYRHAGFRNKAVETWQRALGLAPDSTTRKSIKDQLEALG